MYAFLFEVFNARALKSYIVGSLRTARFITHKVDTLEEHGHVDNGLGAMV
jgi:hypothetical protein